ncbi:M20 family metallo-hydrolase [Lutibacter sp. B2]|nr:M20 family metallo-hydrolase [Lutibacter sp. B2]
MSKGERILNTLKEKLVVLRRDFHKYAEAGWTEFRTSSKIADRLETLGYDVLVGKEVINTEAVMGRMDEEKIQRHIERALCQGADQKWIDRMEGYTGVVGIVDTKIPGPTTALRFDIDSNDAIEMEEDHHRPYREGFSSVNKGAMHACGHDGHAAIGLGVAEALMEIKDQLKGKIKLIFQPAEEGVRGAKAMVEKGIVDDVDNFLAAHIGFGYPIGTVVAKPSGFLCTTKANVFYKGKGSHAGGAPNEGKNALLAASSAVMNLYAIPRHNDGATRINVGRLQAGVGRNVIAPNAFMEIETRGSSDEINQYMYNQAHRILEHSAKMYDVDYKIEKVGEAVACPSDDELVEEIIKESQKLKSVLNVEKEVYFGGSEDATWLMKRVQEKGGKSAYMLLGTTIAAPHHNECFDFDEDILETGVFLFGNLIKKLNGI